MKLIDTGFNDGFYNMAVDEVLLARKEPVLRFFHWKPSCVSLGYFQSIKDIDVEYCNKKKIDIVRRLTGGKALLHDKEITYSLIIDEIKMPKNVIDSYMKISNSVLIALQVLDINAKFKDENIKKDKTPVCLANPSWYEIIVDDKKIAAAAQVRKKGKLLQHGPILMDFDYEKSCSIFRNSNKKMISDTKERITSINQFKKLSYDKLKKELLKGFEENFKVEIVEDELSKKEKEMVDKLVKEKYKTNDWNCKY